MVWNIIPTKSKITQSIPSSSSDTSCSLCSFSTNSLPDLLFTCPIAQVVWRQSFWPLDTISLNVTNMTYWLLIILNPHRLLAAVTCDYLWFIRNKAHHEDLILNALVISSTINKTVLEHQS